MNPDGHPPMARPLRGRVAGGRAGRRPWRGAGDRHRRTPPSRAPHIQPRLLDGHAARRCGRPPGPRLQADARQLPFRAGALAGIWASASLLHLSRPHAAAALEDARRTLAPSGRLLLSVKQGHGSETETARYGLPRFFQYWSGSELDAVLDAAGFRVIDGGTETSPRAEWLVRLAGADRLTPAAARAARIDVRVATPPGSRPRARASRRAARDRRRRRGR